MVKEQEADLVLGLPWLWLRESKIDIRGGGMAIYDKFVPFCATIAGAPMSIQRR